MGKFEYVQLESHGSIIRDDGIAHVSKRPIVFGDEQDLFSLAPAFLDRVEVRGSLREVNDPDVLVLPQQFLDGFCAVRGGSVRHHRHLPEAPLHLLEVSDEGGRVKALVRPET